LGNLHVANPFISPISSLLPRKIKGAAAASLCLGISGRPPLPATHSPPLLRPKKGRICPFPHLLGRGCDDGGEGGSAGAVNRKPGSSARGDQPAFQGSPASPNRVLFFFPAGFHPTVPFEGGFAFTPLRRRGAKLCDTNGSTLGCGRGPGGVQPPWYFWQGFCMGRAAVSFRPPSTRQGLADDFPGAFSSAFRGHPRARC